MSGYEDDEPCGPHGEGFHSDADEAEKKRRRELKSHQDIEIPVLNRRASDAGRENETVSRPSVEMKAGKIPPDEVREELSKMDVLGWWKLGLKPGQTLLDEDEADKERELEQKAQEAVRRLFNNIGDIVQISVEETLRAIFEAVDDQVVSQWSAPVRTGDLRDAIMTVRAHAPAIADRVMERVTKEEDPYGARHRREQS